MITVKCYIETEYLETPLMKRLRISQKEFDETLELLREQVESTVNNECPMVLSSDTIREYQGYTERIVHFNCGCADTYLTKLTAKPGCQFTNNK